MLGRETVAADFRRVTGLPVTVQEPASGVLELQIRDLPARDGFIIRGTQRQRKLQVEFLPGTFAAPLVEAMGEVDEQGAALWAAQAKQLVEAGCAVVIQVNGAPVDPLQPKTWPAGWRFLSISLTRNLVAIDREDFESGLLPADHWIVSFGALLTALLPLDGAETDAKVDVEGEVEGDVLVAIHHRYERSRRNRAAAIAIHGYDCKGCGINLERVYGELGREFIEIHHVTPLSEIETPRVVDPKEDLVPLCPTCHGIIHRRRPAYSLVELRAALVRKHMK
jgi:5-methylcytosine-specific restriction enzyme A